MTKRGTPDGARQNGPALEKAYQFALWLVPTVEKFPRSQTFLLGDRLQSLVAPRRRRASQGIPKRPQWGAQICAAAIFSGDRRRLNGSVPHDRDRLHDGQLPDSV